VLIETVLAALVLGLTAVLVNAEPGRTAQAAAAADARAPIQATAPYDTGGLGGTGRLDIQLNPARSGPNSLDITVQSPSGVNIDVPELDIELSLSDHHLGPLPITLTHQGPAAITAAGRFLSPAYGNSPPRCAPQISTKRQFDCLLTSANDGRRGLERPRIGPPQLRLGHTPRDGCPVEQ
jgi:hypothetical protein